MSGGDSLSDKIQKLLAQLPDTARQALERAVAKARENGKPNPLFDILGQQFPQLQKSLSETPRRLEPSRLFMNPVEDFLISAKPPQKTTGRIWRGSLQPIWAWIEHHLASEEVYQCRTRLEQLGEGGGEEREKTLLAIEDDLRRGILPKLQDELERALQTPDTRRRFAYHIGGESHLQELEDIASLLAQRDAVAACNKALPARPSLNSPADVAMVTKIFTKLASMEARLPYYAAVLLQSKIEQTIQLPLWAAACAGADDLKHIANSPFASLIEISLGDAALMAEQCIAELTKPAENNQAVSFARNYAMTCRNLRAAVDFETQTSDWLRRLSEIRLRISNMIGEELSQMFQLMRRNVRPLRAFGSQNPMPPDAFDLDRLCFLIALMNTVRASMQEFALNELVSRLHAECEDYLQQAVDSLQEELRAQPSSNRLLINAYTQAALRASEAWYGEKHAALLKRGFEAAANAPSQKASA